MQGLVAVAGRGYRAADTLRSSPHSATASAAGGPGNCRSSPRRQSDRRRPPLSGQDVVYPPRLVMTQGFQDWAVAAGHGDARCPGPGGNVYRARFGPFRAG